jgi:hypothetical protein
MPSSRSSLGSKTTATTTQSARCPPCVISTPAHGSWRRSAGAQSAEGTGYGRHRLEVRSRSGRKWQRKLRGNNKTIDFTEIGKRFKAFGLAIDKAALADLNKIRNDMEHLYTSADSKKVREATARAFPVVIALFGQLHEEPAKHLDES